jgi:ATP-dependent protease HslVU (ClpYQ) peptidase subunit
MTIIVYRDGIMAADRNLTTGRVVTIGTIDKITVMRNGAVYAAAGSSGDCVAVANMLQPSGAFKEDVPFRLDMVGIVVQPDGAMWKLEPNKPMFRIDMPYIALGSCGDFALGCLAAGATAEQTVELCSQHCAGIGGGVQVVDTRTTTRRTGVVAWLKEWLP